MINYGLPNEEASYGTLQEMIRQAGLQLSQVAVDAVTPITSIMDDNQTILNEVGAKIRRYLAGKVKSAKSKNESVAEHAMEQLLRRTQGQQGILDLTIQQLAQTQSSVLPPERNLGPGGGGGFGGGGGDKLGQGGGGATACWPEGIRTTERCGN